MSEYCQNIFGDKLLGTPLDDPKCALKPGLPLPSPEQLKYKILVKNKKRKEDMPENQVDQEDSQAEKEKAEKEKEEGENGLGLGGTGTYLENVDPDKPDDKGAWEEREEEAETSLSKLVNYITATPFKGFIKAEQKNVSYEMSSFVETSALHHLKEDPTQFVDYNKRQLSRIYPKGARVASDNYQPQLYWNAGCQMVALNFQTLDVPMQLNIGKFEFNKQCGYIVKPEFMRKKNQTFHPFLETPVEGVVAAELSVRIISGQFLAERKCGTNVELEMYGIANDCVRRKHKTKTSVGSTNPVWTDDPFKFQKVVLPDLAVLRFVVSDDAGKMIGQRIIPLDCIQPGYRYISLRTDFNAPIGMASLFVHIVIKDYIPTEMADFANALCNPIEFLSKEEIQQKRGEMLMKCVDADELEEEKKEEVKPDVKPPGTKRVRLIRGQNPDGTTAAAAPSSGPVAPPKPVPIYIAGLDKIDVNQPAAGFVPQAEEKVIQEFGGGGLYLGDDKAKIVTDREAGVKKAPVSACPWDNPPDLGDDSDEKLLPDIPGVDFNDIAEEYIKKQKNWVKFESKQKKKVDDLVKKFNREKATLVKSHQSQTDKLLKDNAATKANQIKAQDRAAKNKGGEKEKFDAQIARLEEKQARDIKNLKLQQDAETLRVEKIHTREKFEFERVQLKEAHEEFKKQKIAAHAAQLKKFEQTQSNEVNDMMKALADEQALKLKKLAAEAKNEDKEESARRKRELEQRNFNETVSKRKQLNNRQEIRGEQLTATHAEQLKMVDVNYHKGINEFDDNTDKVISELETKLSAIEIDMQNGAM